MIEVQISPKLLIPLGCVMRLSRDEERFLIEYYDGVHARIMEIGPDVFDKLSKYFKKENQSEKVI